MRIHGLLLALCVAGSACGRSADADPAVSDEVPEEARSGGTAVVGVPSDFQALSPLGVGNAASDGVERELLFAPLVRYDEALRPVPWLAERWDTVRVAPDSLELTFRLRRDVRWHDGEPTTARDVAFTFRLATDPRTAYAGRGFFSRYDRRVEVSDAYTVRFRLLAHPGFMEGWYRTPPLPEHLYAEVPPEQVGHHPSWSRHPVGNGPFRFAGRVPGQSWTLEANAGFPAELGGRPYLDRLVFRVLPDRTAALAELLRGGVDFLPTLSPALARRVEGTGGARLLDAPASVWDFITWNTRLPLFDSPEERRALTLALDRPALAAAVDFGYSVPGRATVTPSHPGFDSAAALPHDPAEARRLLAAAGWVDRDGDGVLEDAEGRPFRFNLLLPAGSDRYLDMATVLQAQLRRVGVDMRPEPTALPALIARIEGAATPGSERVRKFDAFLLNSVDPFRKNDSEVLHSRNRSGALNWSGYSDPRLDALLDTLARSVDPIRDRALWSEYQRLMAGEGPFTVLSYPRILVAVRPRLHDVDVDVRGEYASATRWWIAPADR